MNHLKTELFELVKSDNSVFDLVLDASMDGLWYLDLENPPNEWINPRFWRNMGYDPNEMSEKVSAWQQLIHADDLKISSESLKRHCENPAHPYDELARYTHINGSTVWLRSRGIAIRDTEGRAIRMLISHTDVTKEKEAEENQKLLFNSIDEGFCIVEMIFDEQKKPIDYRFLVINSAFEKQTGMRDAVGKRMREFAPDHEEHWFETYGKIAMTGESIRFENRAEQLHRWYDVYAFRFGDPRHMHVAILFNDITERKQAEEQLLAVNKELEAFSYSVAHDLRSPLRSVHGYAEVLNQDFEKMLGEEGKRIIGNIKSNASKMGQLIDDLLAFSRLGRKEVKLGEINMNELIQDVVTELSYSQNHHAKIEVAKLSNVMGDYGLIYQVMVNLISNAIKYSSKGAAPLIQISSEVENDEAVFAVRDNGSGFDMKYANKLFGVFSRLHTDREFEGTGIGLAIVSRIIGKHGGRIWAEGKVDHGAVFYFTLPIPKS